MARMQNGDKTPWCRHEFKYLITEVQAALILEHIRPYMRPDPYCIDGSYPLVSLYLDSDDLRLCRESLEGVKNRFKLRIRSYSDSPDEPRFFEIKRRINRIIVKNRARVEDHAVAALLAGASRAPCDGTEASRTLDQFLHYQRLINAKPTLRVRYLRQAFVGLCNDRTRVTFDRQLSFNVTYTPTVRLDDDGWQRLPRHGVILEIKFTEWCPAWLSQMIRCFGLQSRSLSKYARLVKRASGLRFCGPTVARGSLDGPAMAFF